MMRILVIPLLLIVGCGQNIKEADLDYLNGYWEIVLVKFPNGDEKTYKVNTSIDFIEFNTTKGFRKKVQPNLLGTYRTSNDAEQFAIIKQEGRFLMQYGNGPNQWEEELLDISENRFSVRNQENITYIYNRFQPINPTP
ncbi:MAG: hypothetical protein AAF717_00820 [Bacteroidota bacterium]